MFQNIFLLAQSDPISIGIGVIIVIIFIFAGVRAIGAAIVGGVLGAIIGPMFLDVSPGEGAKGGAIVFGILGFLSVFINEENK